MQIVKRLRVLLILAVCLSVGVYTLAYVYTTRSEAFSFASMEIRRSGQFAAEVGEIEKIRVDPWRGFKHKFSGSDREAAFVVEITGDNGSMKARVKVQRRNDKWSLAGVNTIQD